VEEVEGVGMGWNDLGLALDKDVEERVEKLWGDREG